MALPFPTHHYPVHNDVTSTDFYKLGKENAVNFQAYGANYCRVQGDYNDYNEEMLQTSAGYYESMGERSFDMGRKRPRSPEDEDVRPPSEGCLDQSNDWDGSQPPGSPASSQDEFAPSKKRMRVTKSGRTTSRRARIAYTSKQLDALEERYQKGCYINVEDRSTFARSIGVQEYQIKTWFQNRRAKDKKAGIHVPPPPPQNSNKLNYSSSSKQTSFGGHDSFEENSVIDESSNQLEVPPNEVFDSPSHGSQVVPGSQQGTKPAPLSPPSTYPAQASNIADDTQRSTPNNIKPPGMTHPDHPIPSSIPEQLDQAQPPLYSTMYGQAPTLSSFPIPPALDPALMYQYGYPPPMPYQAPGMPYPVTGMNMPNQQLEMPPYMPSHQMYSVLDSAVKKDGVKSEQKLPEPVPDCHQLLGMYANLLPPMTGQVAPVPVTVANEEGAQMKIESKTDHTDFEKEEKEIEESSDVPSDDMSKEPNVLTKEKDTDGDLQKGTSDLDNQKKVEGPSANSSANEKAPLSDKDDSVSHLGDNSKPEISPSNAIPDATNTDAQNLQPVQASNELAFSQVREDGHIVNISVTLPQGSTNQMPDVTWTQGLANQMPHGGHMTNVPTNHIALSDHVNGQTPQFHGAFKYDAYDNIRYTMPYPPPGIYDGNSSLKKENPLSPEMKVYTVL